MAIQYPNVVITFMIENNSEFIIIKRSKNEKNYPNLWAFPGGKVEIAENAMQTIQREIKEEVGLDVEDDIAFLNTYFFGTSVGFTFLVKSKDRNVVLADENTDYKWISSLKELESLECISGIYNHFVRAQEMLERNSWDSFRKASLLKQDYLN